MADDDSTSRAEDRRSARRGWAENLAPWLRSASEPGFGTMLVLILAQLIFTLSTPAEDWANFVSILLQGAILWVGVVAARIEKGPRRIVGSLIVAVVVVSAIVLFSPGIEIGEAVPTLIAVGLVLFAPVAIVLGVTRSMRVERTITLQVVYGALSIYLLLGYAFALIFQAISELSGANFFAGNATESAPNFLYFAFSTLTGIGGDLTAAEGVGRALTIALALLAQIYLVTVIGVIISNLGAFRSKSGAA